MAKWIIMSEDNKFHALELVVKEFSDSDYPPPLIIKVLTLLERKGIKYILNLPDEQPADFYNKKLDEFLAKELLTNNKK